VLTLREPSRGLADGLAVRDNEARPRLSSSMKLLFAQPSYRTIALGLSMMLCVATGVIAWLPSLLARSRDMQADEVGRWLGLTLGLAGPVGTVVVGGMVADRLSRRDIRWGLWLVAIGALMR
jgi:hypothetical protein